MKITQLYINILLLHVKLTGEYLHASYDGHDVGLVLGRSQDIVHTEI